MNKSSHFNHYPQSVQYCLLFKYFFITLVIPQIFCVNKQVNYKKTTFIFETNPQIHTAVLYNINSILNKLYLLLGMGITGNLKIQNSEYICNAHEGKNSCPVKGY